MKSEPVEKVASKNLTRRQRAELAALAAQRGEQIDGSRIPEVRDWTGGRRGMFFRPVKQQLKSRIDSD
jgi:hypothetical protein